MLEHLKDKDGGASEVEARYGAVIESLPTMICRFTSDGRLTFVNRAFCYYFNKSRDQLLGNSYLDLQSPEQREEIQQHITSLSPANPLVNIETTYQRLGENSRLQRWTIQGIFNKAGSLVEIQAVGHNIDARSQSEAATTQYTKELSALHAATKALLSTLDLEVLLGQILDAAISAIPAAEKGMLYLIAHDTGRLEMRATLGYSESDPRIQKYGEPGSASYIEQVVQKRAPIRIDNLQTAINSRQKVQGQGEQSAQSAIAAPLIMEKRILGALTLESSELSAFSNSDLRLLVNFATTATAAIRNAQLHAEVQKMAITDPLTGLYNRRGFYTMGDREFERTLRFNTPLSIILLDIDLFKQINDTYGHAVGDKVLQLVAEQTQRSVRKVDIVGRYGGDEFILILPGTDHFGATAVAERLRKNISTISLDIENTPITISVSMGIVDLSPKIDKLEDLIKRADEALYVAKQSGRNRVEIS